MNKYVEKVSEELSEEDRKKYAPLGMKRSTYSTLSGVVAVPPGVVVGGVAGAAVAMPQLRRAVSNSLHSKNMVDDSKNILDEVRASVYKSRGTGKSVSLYKPGVSEVIEKNSPINEALSTYFKAVDKHKLAKKIAGKALLKNLGSTLGGATLGGIGSYKLYKHLSGKDYDKKVKRNRYLDYLDRIKK